MIHQHFTSLQRVSVVLVYPLHCPHLPSHAICTSRASSAAASSSRLFATLVLVLALVLVLVIIAVHMCVSVL
jgi:hypothetical protein